jgi:transcription initiation factor IIE alpha subunit
MLEPLLCLYCADTDAVVSMDLTADHTFRCDVCESEWTEAEARAKVQAWTRLLKWLETSPFRCAAPGAKVGA